MNKTCRSDSSLTSFPEKETRSLRKLTGSVYAGDNGEMLPKTALALKLSAAGDVGGAQTALTAALKEERLIVPAPQTTISQGTENKSQRGAVTVKPRENSCKSDSLDIRYSPVGKSIEAYSCADNFYRFAKRFKRPMLMDPQKVALAALVAGGNLWLDPQADYANVFDGAAAFRSDPNAGGGIVLGSPALSALASGDSWLAPWDDPEILTILRSCALKSGVEYLGIAALPGAGLAVKIRVPADSVQALSVVEDFSTVLSSVPQLSARTGFLQLNPVV